MSELIGQVWFPGCHVRGNMKTYTPCIECGHNGDTVSCQKCRRERNLVIADARCGAQITGFGKIWEKIGEAQEITAEKYDSAKYEGLSAIAVWPEGVGIYSERDIYNPQRPIRTVYVTRGEIGLYEIFYA